MMLMSSVDKSEAACCQSLVCDMCGRSLICWQMFLQVDVFAAIAFILNRVCKAHAVISCCKLLPSSAAAMLPLRVLFLLVLLLEVSCRCGGGSSCCC